MSTGIPILFLNYGDPYLVPNLWRSLSVYLSYRGPYLVLKLRGSSDPRSNPAVGENLFIRERCSIAYSLSLLPSRRRDMTEILFKRV